MNQFTISDALYTINNNQKTTNSLFASFGRKTVVNTPLHFSLKRSPRTSSCSAKNAVDSFFSDHHLSYSFNHCPDALMCYTDERLFAASDDIFCLFKGHLDNADSSKKLHRLSDTANHGLIVIQSYKALKDKQQFLTAESARQFQGCFVFILYDKTSKHVYVASGADGEMPLFWGIDSQERLLLCDGVETIKKGCGKSFASFPKACIFTTSGGFLDLRDRLSSLPQHLKGRILSYLSTEEVIRTRELSKEWINDWLHSTSIDIDVERDLYGMLMSKRRQTFENFVRWVVKTNITSLDSFVISGSNLLDLACLDLHGPCFKTLKTLHMRGVKFSDPDLTYNAIKNCSFLEELCLEDCIIKEVVFFWLSCQRLKVLKVNNRLYGGDGICENFVVDAPNLEHLEYRGPCSYISKFDTNSLHQACIHPVTFKDGPFRIEVSSICNVEQLSVNYFFMDSLLKAGVVFPNLLTLTISLNMNKKTVGGLFKFLRCCINLEDLHMVILEGDTSDSPLSVEYIAGKIVNESRASAIVANNLKSVDFIVNGDGLGQLDAAIFFLLHCQKLQNMLFSWTNVPSFNSQSENLLKKLKRSAPSKNFVKRRLI